MRWKSVALLVTVISITSGQYVSIDRDINAITVAPKSDTLDIIALDDDITTHNQTDENNNSSSDNDVNENNSVNDEAESQPENDSGDNDDDAVDAGTDTDDNETDQDTVTVATTTAAQETNESEQENEGNDESNESLPANNESGGEESVEVDPPASNENVVSRSSEHIVSNEELEPISTEGGLVQGYDLHGDIGIRSYIDIPYGTFSGLFSDPTKAASWENVLENQEHLKRCPQINENDEYAGEIDCLTLSVFTPKDVENAAILFHIYDGDFNIGSANPSIYGPEYLVTKGIILVLPNYRLGALGFLCLNNEIAPGNAGLKDLTLALEWTQNNIANFGGDPSKIVVSGDGKSGALAGYLALSPISRQYISGVITESGSLLAPWAIDRNPENSAALLREEIQENITNELNPEELVKATKDIVFRPCIENVFMNQTPWQILHNEEVKIDIPFIIGSANHAGLQEAMGHTVESLTELNENFHKFLPDDLKFEDGEEIDVAEKIRNLYFEDKEVGLEHIEYLSLCYTDAYYLGPSIRVARALVRAGAKVYFYEFSFVGSLNRMLAGLSSTVQGAARGDIVGYAFTQDGEMAENDSNEQLVVELVTDLWVTFLQTGEPSADSVAWNTLEEVPDTDEQFLIIESSPSQKKGVHEDRLALWTQVYENHFIETNPAVDIRSSLCLIATGIFLLFLLKNYQ